MTDPTERASWPERIIRLTTAVALAAMVVLICGLVALREVQLGRIWPAAGDLQKRVLTRYTYVSQLLPVVLCWMTFLGAVLADRRGEHMGNDVFVSRLPNRPRRLIRLSGRFLWVAFFAVLAVLGIAQVAQGESLGALRAIGLPAWVSQLGLPLGAGLLAIMAARSLLAEIRKPPRENGGPA
ncbi:MAG: TRAP transporter small permease subunit [Phycisphaerae bacterium]|nr:TRAP transporter small permease subunit [Phycisphaerae bacterium]